MILLKSIFKIKRFSQYSSLWLYLIYNNLNDFSYETQGETPNNENQLNIINKVLKILIQKYIYLITMLI